MKIKELIEKLQEIEAKKGDIDVRIENKDLSEQDFNVNGLFCYVENSIVDRYIVINHDY